MNDIMISIRTDKKLKESASKVFDGLGMNLSTAINMFLKQAVIKQKFPCEIDSEMKVENAITTYPKGYFKLFGAGKDLDLIDVDDIDVSLDGKVEL